MSDKYEDWKGVVELYHNGPTLYGRFHQSKEDLYQEFKARLIEELKVVGKTEADKEIYGYVEDTE